jgi:hypothetical protein
MNRLTNRVDFIQNYLESQLQNRSGAPDFSF